MASQAKYDVQLSAQRLTSYAAYLASIAKVTSLAQLTKVLATVSAIVPDPNGADAAPAQILDFPQTERCMELARLRVAGRRRPLRNRASGNDACSPRRCR
jgi:hypothetical protein